MAKFLVKFLFFIIPFVILLSIQEYLVRREDNTYTFKKKLFQTKQDSIEILILGSSYAFYDINPEFISNRTFNIANNSEDLYYTLNILKRIINNLPKLKMIILGMGHDTPFYNLEKEEEYWRSSFYKNVYDIPRRKPRLLLNEYSYLYAYGYQRSINMILFHLNNNIKNIEETGWQKQNVASSLKMKSMVENYENCNQATTRSNDIFEKNKYWIQQIIDLSQKHDVKLALVFTPSFMECPDKISEDQLVASVTFFNSLCEQNTNVYCLDYHNDSIFKINDFSDSKHLNYLGAQKFTTILNKEISLLIN